MTQDLRPLIHRHDLEAAATYYKLPERVIEEETEQLDRVRKVVTEALDGQLALFTVCAEGGEIRQANDDGVPHMRMVMDFSLSGWADEWSLAAVAEALRAAAESLEKTP